MSTLSRFVGYGAAAAVLWASQFVVLPRVLAAATPAPTSTAASVTAPLEERHGSGVRGTVTLSPQGDKSVVRVNLFSAPSFPSTLSLRSGADCLDTPRMTTRPIPLNPISSGQVSQTIVAIPISSFKKSAFVVDVRDATTRQQFSEACARIGH